MVDRFASDPNPRKAEKGTQKTIDSNQSKDAAKRSAPFAEKSIPCRISLNRSRASAQENAVSAAFNKGRRTEHESLEKNDHPDVGRSTVSLRPAADCFGCLTDAQRLFGECEDQSCGKQIRRCDNQLQKLVGRAHTSLLLPRAPFPTSLVALTTSPSMPQAPAPQIST